jgi:hypothetical protein
MSNRTLLTMTSLVLVCMALLFLLRLIPVIWPSHADTYLSLNGVEGIEIEHGNLPYTLNFDQQNQMIEMLNMAIPFKTTEQEKKETLDVDKITIYRFNEKPLILTPYRYNSNGNLFFLAPDWNPAGLMKDVSDGELKKLLLTTYDHNLS